MNRQTKTILITSIATAVLIGVVFYNRWPIKIFCPSVSACNLDLLSMVYYPLANAVMSIPAIIILRKQKIANAVPVAVLSAVEGYFLSRAFHAFIFEAGWPWWAWIIPMGISIVALFFVFNAFFNNKKSESPLAFKLMLAAFAVAVTAFAANYVIP